MRNWTEYIFESRESFEEKALSVFEHQFHHNEVYRTFCTALGADPATVSVSTEIPLLPVEAFRETTVFGDYVKEPELVFKSSGTAGMQSSTHYVASAGMYRQSILEGIKYFYNLENMAFWGYVPGYAENPHSSLIWMIKQLIDQDTSGFSRILPLNEALDIQEIKRIRDAGKQLMIFGAAFGFLDLIEEQKYRLAEDTLIMETGGMKTHRREISREELHQELAEGFGLFPENIHSEYGMAEMLSQAYTAGESWYKTPPWLTVTIRNPEDPMSVLPSGEEGLIGIIDLANVHSCSFLLTGDVGIQNATGGFKVLGRHRYANLRGCNFLIEEE